MLNGFTVNLKNRGTLLFYLIIAMLLLIAVCVVITQPAIIAITINAIATLPLYVVVLPVFFGRLKH